MTSGYPPLPEPFSEALGEAAHTVAMAYRLARAVSDAVRRAAQKRLTGAGGRNLARARRRWRRAGWPAGCAVTLVTTSWPC